MRHLRRKTQQNLLQHKARKIPTRQVQVCETMSAYEATTIMKFQASVSFTAIAQPLEAIR